MDLDNKQEVPTAKQNINLQESEQMEQKTKMPEQEIVVDNSLEADNQTNADEPVITQVEEDAEDKNETLAPINERVIPTEGEVIASSKVDDEGTDARAQTLGTASTAEQNPQEANLTATAKSEPQKEQSAPTPSEKPKEDKKAEKKEDKKKDEKEDKPSKRKLVPIISATSTSAIAFILFCLAISGIMALTPLTLGITLVFLGASALNVGIGLMPEKAPDKNYDEIIKKGKEAEKKQRERKKQLKKEKKLEKQVAKQNLTTAQNEPENLVNETNIVNSPKATTSTNQNNVNSAETAGPTLDDFHKNISNAINLTKKFDEAVKNGNEQERDLVLDELGTNLSTINEQSKTFNSQERYIMAGLSVITEQTVNSIKQEQSLKAEKVAMVDANENEFALVTKIEQTKDSNNDLETLKFILKFCDQNFNKITDTNASALNNEESASKFLNSINTMNDETKTAYERATGISNLMRDMTEYTSYAQENSNLFPSSMRLIETGDKYLQLQTEYKNLKQQTDVDKNVLDQCRINLEKQSKEFMESKNSLEVDCRNCIRAQTSTQTHILVPERTL